MIAKHFEDERCDILATLSRDSIVHDTVFCGQPGVRHGSARAAFAKDIRLTVVHMRVVEQELRYD